MGSVFWLRPRLAALNINRDSAVNVSLRRNKPRPINLARRVVSPLLYQLSYLATLLQTAVARYARRHKDSSSGRAAPSGKRGI